MNTYFNFNLLPWHIFEKIYYLSLNIDECDINNNLKLRLVCKYWNSMITKHDFINLYSKKLRIDYINEENEAKNISIYKYIKDIVKENKQIICNSTTNNKQAKIVIDKFLTEKLYFNNDFIFNTHINNYLYNKIHPDLLILSHEILNNNLNGINVLNIPVCYFKSSKCIENICGEECANNYHGLLNYTNHYISRGFDDKGRFYLLFFYKDFEKNRIFYEFIYTAEFKHTNISFDVITYSGYNNICYIGNLSYKKDIMLPYFKRKLNSNSFDYALRLINFEKCGPVEYDFDTDKYIEYEYVYSDDEDHDSDDQSSTRLDVSLYFDKKEIQRNINYNKYINLH